MTLVNPQNILLKINAIKDNIEYLNKPQNTLIKPTFDKYSFINLSNHNLQNYLNEQVKKDISKIKYKDFFKNIDSTAQTNSSPKANYLNNNNISFNSKEDISLKDTHDSLFNSYFLKSNQINNFIQNDINKSIMPQFCDESHSNLNNIKEKAPLLSLKNQIIINKENPKKSKKIFNKFRISHIELKNKGSNRLKHKRKYKADDIRKKIKARFHKAIKNIINENLRKAGSKHVFSFLPQIFISSIARDKNHQVLNLTYRELLQKDFISEIGDKKYKNKNVDISKYKNNLRVLDYLDKNPEICRNSGFDIISKMKYSDLLEEYFKSDEFDKALNKLRLENEEEDYIKEYENKANYYVKFFSQIPSKLSNKKTLKSEDINIKNKNDDGDEDEDKK